MEHELGEDSRLWAPWRYKYISGDLDAPTTAPLAPKSWLAGADRACFLCRAAASFADDKAASKANLVPWRGSQVFIILNRFPYNNGHLLLSPRRHVGLLHELTHVEHLETMQVLGHLTKHMGDWLHAHGYNVGLNLGDVAGAGVPGHLHWHLVPRWRGDKNFMPVTAGTQIISQSLESLWQLLSEKLEGYMSRETP